MALLTKIFHGRGIISTSGPRWKSQRKFSLKALREYGFGRKSIERQLLKEVEHIIEFFASTKGEKRSFCHIYNISTSNVICLMMFGHRFRYDDANFLACCKALNTLVASFSNMSIVNFFPFLLKLPFGFSVSDILNSVQYFDDHLIKEEIKRHYDSYDGSCLDFVAAYIKEIKDREIEGLDASELRENFTETIRDLFMAGTETTATTLEWLILYLILFPEVQEKCYQEITATVGLEHLPTLDDKPNLPYLEATIAETLRRSNLAPFSLPRGIPEDIQFRGFNIPKWTIIMLNMGSVLLDPEIWTNPKDFRPERFLDKNGVFFKPDAFIPFSTGRRVCLGESLAKMELFLFSAGLIQNFRFVSPEDEPTPTMEPVVSAALKPQPYKVKAVPRQHFGNK